MALTDGVSHIATLTDDVDRLIGFYARVFDAEVVFDMTEEGLRHAAIDVGGNTVLHAFSVPSTPNEGRRAMFERGRIDHYGLMVSSMDALLEVRRRLATECGDAKDWQIRDFGPVYSLSFVDPDGAELEVNLLKDGWASEPTLPRAEWTVVDLEPTAA